MPSLNLGSLIGGGLDISACAWLMAGRELTRDDRACVGVGAGLSWALEVGPSAAETREYHSRLNAAD